MTEPRYLTKAELAARYRITVRTLERWIVKGKYPPVTRFRRRVLFGIDGRGVASPANGSLRLLGLEWARLSGSVPEPPPGGMGVLMHKSVVTLFGFVLSVALSGPAQALNTRTWVSGTGVDQAGCGPIATPCRTLQYAHDQTSAGGEINFKDSAGYGSIAITKTISIISDGVFAGVLASSGASAITIDASASSVVVLRGLTIEGAKVGTNGIVFTSGGVLDVSDCVIQNFVNRSGPSGHGILLQPASGSPAIFVRRTSSSHNTNYGINYHPTSGSNAAPTIAIEDVTLANNRGGFAIDAPVTTGTTRINIANTNAPKNINDGFYIFDNRAVVSFDLCSADMNGRHGFVFDNGSVTIGRSRGMNNAEYGLVSSVAVSSFGNSQFNGNGSGQTNATFAAVAMK